MNDNSRKYSDTQQLYGGFMNTPVKKGNVVYRPIRKNSDTIHRLLQHLHKKRITWVPEYHGCDDEGNEILSYIPGDVPHNMPKWIWNESILVDIAQRMRLFHDATVDFNSKNCIWELPQSEPVEVICHNDFAPYNCVFENRRFVGLIDFDVCSPGSRLWDMAYAVYRFVPFMPSDKKVPTDETCPFSEDKMFERTELFLSTYTDGNLNYLYSQKALCRVMQQRLAFLSEWTERYAAEINNEILKRNARMYAWHAEWIRRFI